MRSRLISRAPAFSVMPIMRPSTCSGTPEIMNFGAALGPADHGEDAMAHRAQPVALFARRERDIGLGPLAWPKILVAVEAGGAEPVLHRELEGVLDAEPALLR